MAAGGLGTGALVLAPAYWGLRSLSNELEHELRGECGTCPRISHVQSIRGCGIRIWRGLSTRISQWHQQPLI